ncbi:MAG: ATPase, T2SS/T4P/T4SS family [bacterium]|nr:ATPase, T2SS/T4P/T4SS family [bacterium]
MGVTKNILIVESDLFVAELLSDRFTKDNFTVIRVNEISEAEKIIKDALPILLILSAPKVGEVLSIDFLKKIRSKITKEVLPIIILSHEEDEAKGRPYMEAGATAYLIEAYLKSADIIRIVREILGLEKTDATDKRSEAKKVSDNTGTFSTDSALHYERITKIKSKIEKALLAPEEPSIISLVDDLVEYAYFARTSDIHIDPFDDKIMVRLRIDGVLHDTFSFPKIIQLPLVTRIKVLAGMRTDEHQMAQDGRFKLKVKDIGFIDIRVSIAPTYYGENCVMRILAEQSSGLSLDILGFTEFDKKRILKAMSNSYGMILATGPTGSGKTTTLYTVLKKLNTPEVSIITIEDPIEYSIKGIDQIQVNERTGLTFAHGLRFILRQDPNIIMVGEIRDNETANIAVNAAMTGHLLLSTLHANDAATAIPRLIDMGVEPFLISSTINIVISQRLIRLLCKTCVVKKDLTDAEITELKVFFSEALFKKNRTFYTAPGCKACGGTGYMGRIGIHEILEINDEVRQMIMKRANAGEIKEAALRGGMVPMLHDGFTKAVAGITTLEEVLRVFHE